MSIIFGSARIDENGNTHGGSAGDQTGNEVSTQEFYMHSKGWYGYRPKSVDVANALATAMQQACDNNNIGYDQYERDTLLTQYKKYGSIKAISVKCECDCSSLVRVCIYQASGVLLSDFDTSGEPSVLASSGLFDKITVNSSSDVCNGDVLVTKSKGHTGIIVSGRARSGSSGTTSGTTTVESAASGPDSSIAGTYKVNASGGLNVRYGAGTDKAIKTTLANGTSVQNYGYYTTVSGVKWLLIQMSDGGTGFASSQYLTKTSSSSSSGTTSSTSGGSMTTTADPDTIWNYLYGKLGNAYGTAGLMGNLYAESGLIPINLQDSYESKLGYTDKTYTEAVDNGTYTKFGSDSAGYGLAQWTYSTRKKALLSYCQGKSASIGNLTAQLEFMWSELQSDFSSLVSTLKSATSVQSASDAVLTKYEQPADQGSSVKSTRASYGQTYYDKYAKSSSSSSSGTSGSTSGTTSSSSSLTVDGQIGKKTVTKLQKVMGSTQDGFIDGQQSASKKYWTSILTEACKWTGGASAVVKKLQQFLKDAGYSPGSVDGKLGTKTAKALQNYLIAKGYSCGDKGADGYFGTNSAKALQNWLNKQ